MNKEKMYDIFFKKYYHLQPISETYNNFQKFLDVYYETYVLAFDHKEKQLYVFDYSNFEFQASRKSWILLFSDNDINLNYLNIIKNNDTKYLGSDLEKERIYDNDLLEEKFKKVEENNNLLKHGVSPWGR